MLRLTPCLLTASLLVLVSGGCRDPKVDNYRVKKDPVAAVPPPAASPNAAAPSMANTPVSTAEGQGLTWTAPSTWVSKTGSAMRRGTYVIKGADGKEAELAITAFPGDVGGDLANVNRWRGQLSLPPITDADLPGALNRFTANGLSVAVVDIAGKNDQRILGGIIPHAGATWFFKLTGPDALVSAEKDAFVSYLKTVRAP